MNAGYGGGRLASIRPSPGFRRGKAAMAAGDNRGRVNDAYLTPNPARPAK
jgi:hypothetical protein